MVKKSVNAGKKQPSLIDSYSANDLKAHFSSLRLILITVKTSSSVITERPRCWVTYA